MSEPPLEAPTQSHPNTPSWPYPPITKSRTIHLGDHLDGICYLFISFNFFYFPPDLLACKVWLWELVQLPTCFYQIIGLSVLLCVVYRSHNGLSMATSKGSFPFQKIHTNQLGNECMSKWGWKLIVILRMCSKQCSTHRTNIIFYTQRPTNVISLQSCCFLIKLTLLGTQKLSHGSIDLVIIHFFGLLISTLSQIIFNLLFFPISNSGWLYNLFWCDRLRTCAFAKKKHKFPLRFKFDKVNPFKTDPGCFVHRVDHFPTQSKATDLVYASVKPSFIPSYVLKPTQWLWNLE